MRASGTKRHQKVWFAVLLLYIAIIYSHSMQPAVQSSKESGFVLKTASGFMDQIGIENGWLTEHIVRKTAHFVEYAGMGLLLFANLCNLPDKRERLLTGMLAVVFIPFIDETIQLFASGRAAMVQDVWLDISGAVFGLTAAKAWLLLLKVRREH